MQLLKRLITIFHGPSININVTYFIDL